MSSYSYLFKYIIIGDPSTRNWYGRCGQVVRADAVLGRQVQVGQWDHYRSGVWVKNRGGGDKEGEDADLGHSTSLLDSFRLDRRYSSPSRDHTTVVRLQPYSCTTPLIASLSTTLTSGLRKHAPTPMINSPSSSSVIRTTSKTSTLYPHSGGKFRRMKLQPLLRLIECCLWSHLLGTMNLLLRW